MEILDDRREHAPPPGLAPERRRGGERRRAGGWREFRRAYPGILAVLGAVMLTLLVADGWLLLKRRAYAAENARLRAGMTEVERERTDLILASTEKRGAVMLELLRRQARQDAELHLALSVDSARLYLERDGAILRAMRVEMGPERVVGQAPDTVRLAAPRGKRTVERVLGAEEPWAVPAWVWEDRGLAAPQLLETAGALGANAVVLDGGTVLYARPAAGPLADAVYVMPGSVRVAAEDLRAIAANLRPGMAIYFY